VRRRCPHVDGDAVEQRGGLLDPCQHTPVPVLGQRLEVDLGLDVLAVTPRGQDLDGALEVDVGDVAGLDLGVGSCVERPLAVRRHVLSAILAKYREFLQMERSKSILRPPSASGLQP
jgi:hypothetical protein